MQDTKLLNNIAFNLVQDKAIKDKTEQMIKEEQEQQDLAKQARNKTKEELLDDLDDVDSEEERIMRKELERRVGETAHRREVAKKKLAEKYGQYREIIETEFLDTMLKNNQAVCHFYHKDFERCKIMDKHLSIIAQQHPETLFVKINAEKTPFFTEKLKVRVLPTVCVFKDGKEIDRIVGFADIGMSDDFPTINLTRKLVRCKIIKPKNKAERGDMNINKKGKKKYNEDDSDENAQEDDDDELDY